MTELRRGHGTGWRVARVGPMGSARSGRAAAAVGLVVTLAATACTPAPPAQRAIDAARLREPEARSWLAHGRTQDEQRHSPLVRIHERNAADLGLAWSFDLETEQVVEATPLVADGVMYVTGPWSVVHALDARTGARRWTWDPGVATRHRSRVACCGVVNRGVALHEGRVYVGTLDGRLVALDAASGEPVWQVVTFDREQPYTITGAPRVVAGNVIIGNGGAEFGVRGYVSAYDAATGELVWRTYTVPGDPSLPFESGALEQAASTWSGEWWKRGGGGTVWDSMAYDPGLDLLYVGTGNGSPQARELRSPGGGDNLFLASILALRPRTGELVWHYQTTPADNWDYTATQHIVLADLQIGGRTRKVAMQAPKNGFFFVLDRETGEFISGVPFARVTWARGIDAAGRPVEAPEADYGEREVILLPGPMGAHNWNSMSFSPETGLVYLPAHDLPWPFVLEPGWVELPNSLNTGMDLSFLAFPPVGRPELTPQGYLLAWDPVAQREVWRKEFAIPMNGGTLSTAGNLVFQGTADGRFVAYRASDGAELWEAATGTGVVAAPISYELDGVQYVAIAAGFRGAGARGKGRVLAFTLGGNAGLDPAPPAPEPPALPPAPAGASVSRGGALYVRHCLICHGTYAVGDINGPDLRFSPAGVHDRFVEITLGGIRADLGMPSFADVLGASDVRDIQAYILARAAGSGSDGAAPRD